MHTDMIAVTTQSEKKILTFYQQVLIQRGIVILLCQACRHRQRHKTNHAMKKPGDEHSASSFQTESVMFWVRISQKLGNRNNVSICLTLSLDLQRGRLHHLIKLLSILPLPEIILQSNSSNFARLKLTLKNTVPVHEQLKQGRRQLFQQKSKVPICYRTVIED